MQGIILNINQKRVQMFIVSLPSRNGFYINDVLFMMRRIYKDVIHFEVETFESLRYKLKMHQSLIILKDVSITLTNIQDKIATLVSIKQYQFSNPHPEIV